VHVYRIVVLAALPGFPLLNRFYDFFSSILRYSFFYIRFAKLVLRIAYPHWKFLAVVNHVQMYKDCALVLIRGVYNALMLKRHIWAGGDNGMAIRCSRNRDHIIVIHRLMITPIEMSGLWLKEAIRKLYGY